jgi:hypothetical protein
MTDEDRQDHEEKADQLERELDDMQHRSGKLGDEIESAGEDWEQKKRDPGVPGAAGAPSEADGPQPEAEYPTKDVSDDDLDFGRDVETEDVVGEDGPPAEDED